MVEVTPKKEKKIARMRKYLIEATEDLIQDEGFQAVTLRKIGDETGYNTATIYNYFKDLNELLLYSSVKMLKNYNWELSSRLDSSMNAVERYICVFRIFCKHTFARPEIYYNMFYGKHGKNLGEILSDYYKLFPDEWGGYDDAVTSMLRCGDIFEREYYITDPIWREGFITREDSRHLAEIAIYAHEFFLRESCEHKEGVTAEGQSQRYEDCLLYLLRKMKLRDSAPVPVLENMA